MVSAGAGNKKALGIDRNANPWSDIPLADVWVAGSNVAETFPITTSYIWQAATAGALIVQDPRVVPLARTADLFLPVRPGTDSALFGAVLHELIEHDWLDHDFIAAHTVGFDEAAAAVAPMTAPPWAAGVTGVPQARIERAAEWWGTSATGMLLHARGIEQQSKGTENVLAAINLGLATGKYGKPGCGVTTITGQGNGQGGREHGHKCDQLPGNRDITTPSTGAHIASVWGCDESEIPGKGMRGDHRGDPRRPDQGLLSICFNPAVSAGHRAHRGGVRPARVLRRHRLLPVGDGHADVVLPGSLHEEDEHRRRPARVASSRSTGPSTRQARRGGLADPPRHRRRLGKGRYFPYTNTEQIFEELRLASAGGTADYRGATWRRIEDEMGLFWPMPEEVIPGPAAVRRRPLLPPDGKARFHAVPFASRPRWSTTTTPSG